jgi:hypothetical protein
VRERGRLRPPVRFDTTAALRRSDTTAAPAHDAWLLRDGSAQRGAVPWPAHQDADWPEREGGPSAYEDPPPVPQAQSPPPAPADTFPHARHTSLACIECHETASGRGGLTFEAPRGCLICHHQAPPQARCAACHQTEELAVPQPAAMTISIPGRAPIQRPVGFLHSNHTTFTCTSCHTTPVTLAPAPAKAQCAECHDEHHTEVRRCTACHTLAAPATSHPSLEVAHQRCDACHAAANVARLTPTRNFCATCHTTYAANHYEPRECSTCHFLATPAAYRSKLRSNGRG